MNNIIAVLITGKVSNTYLSSKEDKKPRSVK
jgi:hypothetical protein